MTVMAILFHVSIYLYAMAAIKELTERKQMFNLSTYHSVEYYIRKLFPYRFLVRQQF